MSEIIVGGAIWIACFIGGIGIGNAYKKRKEFFTELLDFDTYLNSCVVNLKMPILQVIDNYIKNKDKIVVRFFQGVAESIDTGDKEILNKKIADSPLFKKDRDMVFSYFADIGKSGYDTQIALLKHHTQILSDAANKAQKEYASNGKLCYKLGFLLGLAIMILVV
ncbi:MAG: stage III sporulation protein AB [Christensenellales bacterium]